MEKILKDCEVYFVKAVNDEVDGKFIEAFTNYKSGIACLLNGLKSNDVLLQKNTYQQSFISNKAQRYIEHAENLFKTHLKDHDNYCFQNTAVSSIQNISQTFIFHYFQIRFRENKFGSEMGFPVPLLESALALSENHDPL